MRMVRTTPFPTLPFDVSELEKRGVFLPDDIKAAIAYREFFEMLTGYARNGLMELRVVHHAREAC